MFLLYAHNKNNFLFGPFRCNVIDKDMFNSIIVQYKNIKNSEKELLYELFAKGHIKMDLSPNCLKC